MEQNSYWSQYWQEFLEHKKLENFVSEMNEVDELLGNTVRIEDICFKIYEDYQGKWKDHLEQVRADFLKMLEGFQYVHLQTSRVKKIDSLLEKVILKRYNSLQNSASAYAKINGENYKDIVTDLIGMRIILNYRGNWKDIHEEILNQFIYEKELFESEEMILPHPNGGENVIAQIPKVYYAQGDDTKEFSEYGFCTELHSKGYRSIHYIVSYQGVYVELQVRTIYDEAWSDCDHNYVYKQDHNHSHTALLEMSRMLCRLTNISNDMGETMKEIFEKQSYTDIGDNRWEADEDQIKKVDITLKKLYYVIEELKTFQSNIQIKQGVSSHGK